MKEVFTIAEPNFLENKFPLDWHMSRNERYAFIKLLEEIRPKVAIEIGCFKGGSLQVLSAYCDKVYSIDINPDVPKLLNNKFNNVEFIIGNSNEIIPNLLKKIEENQETLEFVLIDGEHTINGVKNDIENVLKYIPSSNLYVVFHDSFNPSCRKGIKRADYSISEYVHYVELDFISGVFSPNKLYRQMWGGLAMVLLKPEKRTKKLIINECQKRLYHTIYWMSLHPIIDNLKFLHPYKPKIKKILLERKL